MTAMPADAPNDLSRSIALDLDALARPSGAAGPNA
jgi:hypothetical protein